MKQVISASRRTDIPAFYLKWFIDKIRTGNVEVANPLNRRQVKPVPLSPDKVAWIVFWSRNYGAFLKNREYFQNYQLYFHFTINPENQILEPEMISNKTALFQLESLVHFYGPERIMWRYDPITFYRLNGELLTNHAESHFSRLVKAASDLGIRKCTISFAHLYPKVQRRSRALKNFEFHNPANEKKWNILQEIAQIAAECNISIHSCSADELLQLPEIKKGSCINGVLLNRLSPEKVSEKSVPGRKDCGCTASVDIGDYLKLACKYHCIYCYARP